MNTDKAKEVHHELSFAVAMLVTGCASKPPMTYGAAESLGKLVGLTVICERDGFINNNTYLEYEELTKWVVDTWDGFKQKGDVFNQAGADIVRCRASSQACRYLHSQYDKIITAK